MVPWILREKDWFFTTSKWVVGHLWSLTTFFRKLKEKFAQIDAWRYESCITSFPKCLRPQFIKLWHKLGHRKLCARWVPKIVTDDHKTKWMCSALKFLTRCAQEGNDFLDYIVTGDEIRVLHHASESKQQSLQWRHTHSPRTKKNSELQFQWTINTVRFPGEIRHYPGRIHACWLKT